MNRAGAMHIVTVGMLPLLVRNLWDRVQQRGNIRISHIAHASFNEELWRAVMPVGGVSFLREDLSARLPSPDRQLLASLEITGVPTIHNMILSDRFVSKLPYDDALAYATLLTQKIMKYYDILKPTVAIGGFDSLHGSLGFAVAKVMGIPWFALNFSSLPSGQAALCADLGPASRVTLEADRSKKLRPVAERLLLEFVERKIEAAAYIPPKLFSAGFIVKRMPGQLGALMRIARRRGMRDFLKYTEYPNAYSISGLFREAIRLRMNVFRLREYQLLRSPPDERYAFFGLHTQPESSIDVFAHFFSNQFQVVELIARSLPPTHSLLVKLHKSDVPNYSPALLAKYRQLPGLRLVSPYADTFEFISRADVILSIQGTIGLEGALLGKPVIMFGDSPTRIFPSVSTIGRNPELPDLIRKKIGEAIPERAEILEALAEYLAPFYTVSSNDWSIRPTDAEIDGYIHMFGLLDAHLRSQAAA
jgi:hypothetical protein